MEIRYSQQLRKIAGYVDTIVKGFDVNDSRSWPLIQASLNEYSSTLHHWAQNAAGKIMTDVALRDEKTWLIYAQDMSRGVRDQIRNTDIGAVYQGLLNDQVRLIKSLPLEAAQRVHDLSTRALIEGSRASEISSLIMATGHVTKSRANTIARTEISRATTLFTEARAKDLGSNGYIWRTSEDGDVRHEHDELNGVFVPWDKPPIVDKKSGRRAHAGCDINCRCYPEPVIPGD
ncbi:MULTISPECIES: phage minor head protein [Acinetobacter]|uniref:Phage head morphogenesis protein n=1 Tax=Acinetobacter bouvetii TaxID=202951 RepID=A0A4Q7ALR1_9GAMM|nr:MULTISPECIES: phage minor head protein [Acinetobacter]RZG63932.1 phage head morphogenesis protein [Acinetobacter bouvetii]TCB73242.1 phage head morphogenesis protein [Acinetobacter sp. ANC 4177]